MILDYPELSAEDQAEVDFHQRAAHSDVILLHLNRLALHKHLKGGDNQRAFLLKDYTERLDGITELDLFEMVEYFLMKEIKKEADNFFPQLGEVLSFLKKRA